MSKQQSNIDQFNKILTTQFENYRLMEIIDDPIVANIKSKKHDKHTVTFVLAQHQAYLIEAIEIKGIKRKDTLFNSKECLLGLTMGNKSRGHYNDKIHYNFHT